MLGAAVLEGGARLVPCRRALGLRGKLLQVDDQLFENELWIQIHPQIAAHFFDVGTSIEKRIDGEAAGERHEFGAQIIIAQRPRRGDPQHHEIAV